jgi:hypothetical protein
MFQKNIRQHNFAFSNVQFLLGKIKKYFHCIYAVQVQNENLQNYFLEKEMKE